MLSGVNNITIPGPGVTTKGAGWFWTNADPLMVLRLNAADHDHSFDSVANLPPLTPRFAYVQQFLFSHDFR